MKSHSTFQALRTLVAAGAAMMSLSACAGMNSGTLFGDDTEDRPYVYVLTHEHGTHQVFTDMNGLPYKKGSTIPFVTQSECRYGVSALIDKHRCGEVGGSVFDGIIVERMDSRQCKVTEVTVARMDVVRVSSQTTTIPRVQERSWTVLCK